jgi:hypothetical protein
MAHRNRRPRANRIFDDVPENADETWTHGAMVGGMGGYDDRDLADSCFLAADALVERVLADRESMRTRELAAPTMYLYRHGIELFLKLILRPKRRDHGLDRLLGGLRRLVRMRYGQELPRPVADAITEFCQYDPHAVAFRFATDKTGRLSRGKFECGEVWIDLREAKAKMAKVRYALRRCLIAEEMGAQIPPPGVGDLRFPLESPPDSWRVAERPKGAD